MRLDEFLRCPVCGGELQREENSLRCPLRHTYDIARQGYVNLLSGAAGAHGDNREMINARRAFLEAGYYAPLARAAADVAVRSTGRSPTVLDAGCGECYYTAFVADALAAAGKTPSVFGFDVSKEAVKLASHRKCAGLFTASCYAMPVADRSVDLLLCMFAPEAREEFARVVRPGGTLVLAVPGRRHLYGLKSVLYDTPYENEPQTETIPGFSLAETVAVEGEITVSSQEEIAALFAMTPYYYRTPEAGKARLAACDTLQTEISFLLPVYRRDGK